MDKTYTIIPDFMLDYNLTMTETVALAVIYGFCQDGTSDFHGSYSYLARKCKVQRRQAIRVVSKLIDKGYVNKKVETINGVQFCSFRTIIEGSVKMTPPVTFKHQGSDIITPGGSVKMTPNNINKETIKDNKNILFDFLSSLTSIGVTKETAQDWLRVRKTKRATNTKIAFDKIVKEIRKSGRSAEDCIRTAVENSWSGFNAEWMPKAPQKLEYFGDIEGFINARKNNGTNAQ